MDKFLKTMIVAVAALSPLTQAHAQEETSNKVDAYIAADVVSHYVWRGQDKGGISIQPEASISWKGLKLNLEGNAGLEASEDKELDVTLSYEKFGFNIGVIDYWVSGIDKNDRYFHYDKKGAHQFEANIGYTCQYGSLQLYTIFWGNDFKISGERAYSSYAQLDIPFKLGGLDWNIGVGGTFYESAGQLDVISEGTTTESTKRMKNYYYADGPTCVMASVRATKTLDLGVMHLPVFAEVNANPYLQTAHMLFGVTISPF